MADCNGVRQCVRLAGNQPSLRFPCGHERLASIRLHAKNSRQTLNETQRMHFAQALPNTANRTTIADAHHHPIREASRRSPRELFRELERYRLLALDQIRVDSAVAVVPSKLRAGLHAKFPGLVVCSLNLKYLRAEHQQLRNLCFRSARRHKDGGWQAHGGCEPGKRRSCIPRGSAGDARGFVLERLHHAYRTGAIFERCGWVASFILDPASRNAQLRSQPRCVVERSPANLQGRQSC